MGVGVELLISEITGRILAYPVPPQKSHAYFDPFPPIFGTSTTPTLPQITSQEFINHIKQYFMTTSPLTYVNNGIQEFVKCCIKIWVYLDLRPNNTLFGRLQPKRQKLLTEKVHIITLGKSLCQS